MISRDGGKDAGEVMRRTRCHRVAIRQSRRDTKTLERLLTVLGASTLNL